MQNFIYLINSLWNNFSNRRKKQFSSLLILMLISSFAEVLSLGAILPFLAALSDPNYIYTHKYAQPLVQILDLTSPDQIILPMVSIFIGAVIFSGIIRVLLLYVMTKLSYAAGADISFEIYNRTLHQNYDVHISRNSSEIINSIIRKTDNVISGIISPILQFISSTFLFVSVLIALFSIDVLSALVSSIGFGTLYWLIVVKSRHRLKLNSQRIADESTKVIQSLQEGLGGIRDVLLDGNQKFYCNMYRKSDSPLRHAQGNNSFITGSPRFMMEALGMILIAGLAYFLTRTDGGITTAIPILGALALGAQRMLPALQQAYGSISTIRGSYASFQDVLKLLEQPFPNDTNNSNLTLISFDKKVSLKGISFRYTNKTPWILKDIDLEIIKGSSVGFIGHTGSGKSTLFDIIMGLLSSANGSIFIDDLLINVDNIHLWQKHIAHVPQSVFLSDGTISENIAFGYAEEEIDFDRVKKAAKQAQMSKFIEKMELQYQTKVGERGVKLSGGQRQRIGIARALYKEADVIIFDEATSALDNKTESEIINTINGLKSDLTILMIAHRLTTLKNCDKIIELENGNIKRVGTFKEIILK
jgi:ATP-binding cassette, subfamily B, bacterial PglK